MENVVRSLFVYLRDYRKETVLAPLFKMLEASFELFVPLVMASMIDKGIGKRRLHIDRECHNHRAKYNERGPQKKPEL